jgi:hypothetical protein
MTRLVCPNCTLTAPAALGTVMHTCPGLAGLSVPLQPEGSRVRHVVVEREDYVGSEDVQTDDNGRPVMAVLTERPDGSNDTVVYAPAARGRVS